MYSLNRSLGLALLCCFLLPHAEGGVIFNSGTDWKWRKGTAEVSSPNTLWRQLSFPDGTWPGGDAPFFYGENLTPGTLITDMRNSYSTIFLRKTFTVEDPSQIATMDLDVRCDDGFIAWINGQQVASANAPGNPAYNAFAPQAASEPANFQTYRILNPGSILQTGANVIAVQMFNVSLTSSDLVFDAQLFTTERETDPPVVSAVSPFPGTVTSLTEITVTFNEPVQGVDAADLRVNDRAATSVSGSGAVYTFRFPQPEFGSVQVAWAVDANIQDLAVPPNSFETGGANSRFVYELADPSFPLVLATYPPPGITVRELRGIGVHFSKPVTGVTAGDLLINGEPATNVTGTGAGPYIFLFANPPEGTVTIDWDASHEIVDLSPTPKTFEGNPWSYTLDANLPIPDVRINEISAANMTGLLDQDGSAEDWIELHNSGASAVDLNGWSITDDPEEPGKWVFPPVTIPAGGYLVIFASGKDRRELAGGRLHTNFKLSLTGEYLGLFTPDAPRAVASELAPVFPEQRNDFSYGLDPDGEWKYHATPRPGLPNGISTITGLVAPVEFSVKRGFFVGSFQLSLHTATPGAEIRYTFDGTEPTPTTGFAYNGLVLIDRTRIVRAAAFKTGLLPSLTRTHTYIFNPAASLRYLPALSLVTAPNNLYGATGIMEVNPRNTTQHGMAWERPVSVELIRPEDNGGFQIDAGIRVHGGGYIRERYDYRTTSLPASKYSFRLYFRGDYGPTKLDYPLIEDIPIDSFDEIVLRAGMNDHSNPFIRDEFARSLSADVGIVASHGTFVNLFLNGVYKGIYNPTERISRRFLQQWHGGGDQWDLIGSNNEVIEGDSAAWTALRNFVNSQSPAVPANYLEITRQLDVTNFIDYLLPNIYADTDDWPHNNWRAARERTPEGRFRFYSWDAEWSFGYSHGPSYNTIVNQLSTTSPPWGTTDIQRLFTRLLLSPEFRLLFADRVHKHFFNGGALTDERIRARYEEVRAQVIGTIPNFNNTIGTSWIPQRRRYVTNHFATSGLIASSNAPTFSQFGGRVPRGFELEMTAPLGTIYFTTNGVDPRPPFSAQPHATAQAYTSPIQLPGPLLVRARTLNGSEWSALTEAAFEIERLGSPLRITEIMYNPLGGESFEFIEIQNTGGAPIDLGGITVNGINYRFPEDTPALEGGATIVLANSVNPALFAQRYPGIQVAGYFEGTLSNGGEILSIQDPTGNILTQVTYDDENGWPASADGSGYSLELINLEADQAALANWQRSAAVGGSPGAPDSPPATSPVVLHEVMAENLSAVPISGTFPDWVELKNTSSEPVDLAQWSLTDDSNPRKFVFPADTILAPGAHLVVYCASGAALPGLTANFGLSRGGETVLLYDANTNRADAISWGPQVAEYSIGRNSDSLWVLNHPTPGAANETAPTAPLAELKLNEFLANAAAGAPDWLELHNLHETFAAAIGECYLTITNHVSRIAPLSFIPAAGYLQLFADEESGPEHLLFKLPASGDRITLHTSTGEPLDAVTFAFQTEGASAGRLPNGTGAWVRFNNPTPGAANYLPEYDGPVINEVLARSTTGPDWIELHNPDAADFDLGGMSLSLNRPNPGQWRFPLGTIIPAGGYLVLSCDPLAPQSGIVPAELTIGPALRHESGGVYLFNLAGQLVESVEYGAQLPSQSIGRASAGWVLTASNTPGAENAPGASLGNPLNLAINEWMAAPVLGDDWFELYNPDDLPVHLGGLYLSDDPSIYGRTNTRIAPLTFIPPRGFVLLQADGETDRGRDHTAFSLSSLGETLRLYTATLSIIDEVNYLPQFTGVSEGRFPDGSAEIISFPGSPTPGSANLPPGADTDQDGMPDDWETLYGLQPSLADGHLDLDADGITNLEEFLAGTDPSDPASLLLLAASRHPETGALLLTFTAAAGRSYTIFYTEQLPSGQWDRLLNIEAAPETSIIELQEPPAQNARFYRIVTPLQP